MLVEAGPADDFPFVAMPIAHPQLFTSQRDWDLATDPEPGLDDRSVVITQGKMLGGSSSINGMVYMRGNREEFTGYGRESTFALVVEPGGDQGASKGSNRGSNRRKARGR